MRSSWIHGCLLAALLLAGTPAQGQTQTDWPTAPVRVVVPFPPGGANDMVARPYADALSQMLKQPFVVENRGGAGGTVGLESVLRAPPDGYTFCMCASTVISTVANLRKVSFTAKDVDPVAMTTIYLSGLLTGPKMPATSFEEFIRYAKANPGKVIYGSSGVGSPTELRMKYLGVLAGIEMVHVPYNGNAQGLVDLLAGSIDAIVELNGFPHVKTGKLRMLAFFGDERHPDFPDVPTMAEVGYPTVNTPIWQGFYAPPGIPQPIREKMNRAVADISARPAMQQKLLAMGLLTRSMPLDELRAFYLADDAANKKIIREANIRID